MKALARRILEDVLSAGSALTAGPVLNAQQEGEVLDAIEARLAALAHRAGGASDDELSRRFRDEHPDLFRGSAKDRHGAARRAPGPK